MSGDEALKEMVGDLREGASRSTSEGLGWMLKLIRECQCKDSTNSGENISNEHKISRSTTLPTKVNGE